MSTSTSVNDNITVPDVQQSSTVDDSGDRLQNGFGCLCFRPACLQFLANARSFLLFMCLCGFFQSMATNGLLGVTISTIERRFALSSSQSAWIAASYEIAAAPALLIIGYIGSTLRRPVWIAGGLLLFGIGLGIYWIPHYLAPAYRYAGSGDSSNLCIVVDNTAAAATINSSLSTNHR